MSPKTEQITDKQGPQFGASASQDSKSFDVAERSPHQTYKLLTSVVAPRPIAVVSTVNRHGEANLSPFSFFNMFSARPPVLVIGVSTPAKGGVKDTLANARETGECVVHIVDRPLARKVSLASALFASTIDEFGKAGLTAIPSSRVRPPRMAEAPVALECVVRQIIPVGEGPGAGNLIVAEVLLAHVAQKVLGASGDEVDPRLFAAAARLGGDWWSSVDEASLFRLPKPEADDCLGVAEAEAILSSTSLTSGEVFELAHASAAKLHSLFGDRLNPSGTVDEGRLRLVRAALAENDTYSAWRYLLHDGTA